MTDKALVGASVEATVGTLTQQAFSGAEQVGAPDFPVLTANTIDGSNVFDVGYLIARHQGCFLKHQTEFASARTTLVSLSQVTGSFPLRTM